MLPIRDPAPAKSDCDRGAGCPRLRVGMSAPIPLQEAGNSLYWGTAHVMCKLSLTSNIASSLCALLVAARSRSTYVRVVQITTPRLTSRLPYGMSNRKAYQSDRRP